MATDVPDFLKGANTRLAELLFAKEAWQRIAPLSSPGSFLDEKMLNDLRVEKARP